MRSVSVLLVAAVGLVGVSPAAADDDYFRAQPTMPVTYPVYGERTRN
jgi:hypothetical protein